MFKSEDVTIYRDDRKGSIAYLLTKTNWPSWFQQQYSVFDEVDCLDLFVEIVGQSRDGVYFTFNGGVDV